MSLLNQIVLPLAGGSLIGLSATTLLLGNGDILGASGIVRSIILEPKKSLTSWKMFFMASFMVTAKLYGSFILYDDDDDGMAAASSGPTSLPTAGYIASGFLVGFGTSLGNGCTSGHGICGLARLSKRSLVAVLSFMSTGVLSSTFLPSFTPISNYLWNEHSQASRNVYDGISSSTAIAAVIACLLSIMLSMKTPLSKSKSSSIDKEKELSKSTVTKPRNLAVATLSGSLFSVGLGMSGMTDQAKIYGFLNMNGFKTNTWDASLIFVMGGGLLVSFIGYQFVDGYNVIKHSKTMKSPITKRDGKFNVPCSTKIDIPLIVGASIFGLGWGIGGLCPGPAIFSAVNGVHQILFQWWPYFILGSAVSTKIKQIV